MWGGKSPGISFPLLVTGGEGGKCFTSEAFPAGRKKRAQGILHPRKEGKDLSDSVLYGGDLISFLFRDGLRPSYGGSGESRACKRCAEICAEGKRICIRSPEMVIKVGSSAFTRSPAFWRRRSIKKGKKTVL